MNRIQRDTLLGLVFFGTLALLLWATVNLTDLSFGNRPKYDVYFQDAGAAQVGANVLVLGKKNGKIGAIDFVRGRTDGRRIRMQLLLTEPLDLRRDARIEVQEGSVLGGKQIYVDPGADAEPWPAGTDLLGNSRPGAFDRVGDAFDGSGPLGRNIFDTVSEIRQFFHGLNDPDTSVGRLVTSHALYDEILGTVQGLHRLVQSVEDGDGILGRIIKDSTLRDNASRLLANLADLSDRLKGTDGTVGMLLNDRAVANDLRAIVGDLATIVADTKGGNGALGKLLRDPKTERDFTDAIASLAAFLAKANDPSAGTIGALAADPDLANDLRRTVANFREITDKINSGKGPLALLINDEDLGLTLRRIFNQVSRALEDAREAAPIANFVTVITSAF